MDEIKVFINDVIEYLEEFIECKYIRGRYLKLDRDKVYDDILVRYVYKRNKEMECYLLNIDNEIRIFKVIYVLIKLTRGVRE